MRIALSTGGGDASGLNAVRGKVGYHDRAPVAAHRDIPLADVLKIPKRVEVDHDTVLTARATGISFGD
ncbi:MAG TPA: hypothetical protein VK560_05375 [Gemmatimonadaceae bacterium]|nr:hypothetical protein [Gemmatimonadaceae bacterium]